MDKEWILILHPVNPVHPVIPAFHFELFDFGELSRVAPVRGHVIVVHSASSAVKVLVRELPPWTVLEWLVTEEDGP